ncbi:MAG: enoyl-CoA hydratase [Acetobacteraceae bacterium]|nr:enoyl-CoA hydratase [Acetobacteraceae bacterium]
MSYEMIQTEVQGRAGIVRLNRPQALNALCDQLMRELGEAVAAFDRDPAVAAIIVTGSEKAFAAGADIKEMLPRSYPAVFFEDFIAKWETITLAKKPTIAAVSGFALGGGCELAMMCDMIIAAETAKFGQPEIKLGIIPGAGGTQRLTRAVGKSKAMDLVLTGRMMDAQEAERCGLAARVVPADRLMETALEIAQTIGSYSGPSVAVAKEAVNVAFETTLTEGVRFERRTFYALFATADQKEGMGAFAEKRKPSFSNR